MYFENLGYELKPARTYTVTISRDLTAEDGQSLGYTWLGVIENWHSVAFCSFEGGHGVWEASGGTADSLQRPQPQEPDAVGLPAQARRPDAHREEAPGGPTKPPEQEGGEPEEDNNFVRFGLAPPVPPVDRALKPEADVIQAYGLSLKPYLSQQGTGLVWAALKEGEPIPKAYHEATPNPEASLIQVTNLAINVKDSPLNTLVFVTRLDNAAPVEGAKVEIRNLDNPVVWPASRTSRAWPSRPTST